jgi:hypothetical protein
VTTVVEPEQPQGSPKGKRLLFVVGGIIAAVALIIVGACAIGDERPSPDDLLQPDITQGPFIAEASFVLQNFETLTVTESEFWQGLTLDDIVSQGLPFTRYNRYYTRVFLKEGEAVEIIVEANVPLGADLSGAMEGISVMLIPGSAPYGASHAHDYLPATETGNSGYFDKLTRTAGKWQIGWAIGAPQSDYYWLILANTARQDAWCHFTVSVPSG